MAALIALFSGCGGGDTPSSEMVMSPARPGADSGIPVAAPSGQIDASTPPLPDAAVQTTPEASVPRMDAALPGSDSAVPDTAPLTPGDASIVNPSDASGDGAAAADASVSGAAPFPRTNEVNVTAKGPYTFKTYTEGLKDPAYDSAIMYYPENAPLPLAVIVFAPGFTATKENYTKLGEIFASHGFAMMLTTPTNTDVDFPPERGKDLVAAVARIKTENERAGSPLQGKLAWDRICVTGQSMGGGGTLWAATDLGDKIRCAVPLQPWEPGTRFAMIKAPTLFIAAQADDIAGVAENARVHYDSIPNSVEKIFAEYKDATHYLTTNRTTMWDDQARVMVSFYKLKLEDDMRYAPYLYGGMEPKASLSRYEFSKK